MSRVDFPPQPSHSSHCTTYTSPTPTITPLRSTKTKPSPYSDNQSEPPIVRQLSPQASGTQDSHIVSLSSHHPSGPMDIHAEDAQSSSDEENEKANRSEELGTGSGYDSDDVRRLNKERCKCCHLCRTSMVNNMELTLWCPTCNVIICRTCIVKRLKLSFPVDESIKATWTCPPCQRTCRCKRCVKRVHKTGSTGSSKKKSSARKGKANRKRESNPIRDPVQKSEDDHRPPPVIVFKPNKTKSDMQADTRPKRPAPTTAETSRPKRKAEDCQEGSYAHSSSQLKRVPRVATPRPAQRHGGNAKAAQPRHVQPKRTPLYGFVYTPLHATPDADASADEDDVAYEATARFRRDMEAFERQGNVEVRMRTNYRTQPLQTALVTAVHVSVPEGTEDEERMPLEPVAQVHIEVPSFRPVIPFSHYAEHISQEFWGEYQSTTDSYMQYPSHSGQHLASYPSTGTMPTLFPRPAPPSRLEGVVTPNLYSATWHPEETMLFAELRHVYGNDYAAISRAMCHSKDPSTLAEFVEGRSGLMSGANKHFDDDNSDEETMRPLFDLSIDESSALSDPHFEVPSTSATTTPALPMLFDPMSCVTTHNNMDSARLVQDDLLPDTIYSPSAPYSPTSGACVLHPIANAIPHTNTAFNLRNDLTDAANSFSYTSPLLPMDILKTTAQTCLTCEMERRFCETEDCTQSLFPRALCREEYVCDITSLETAETAETLLNRFSVLLSAVERVVARSMSHSFVYHPTYVCTPPEGAQPRPETNDMSEDIPKRRSVACGPTSSKKVRPPNDKPRWWAFSFNPTKLKPKLFLFEGNKLQFPVRQHFEMIRAGDRVALWMCGGAAAFVATAEVRSDPVKDESPVDDSKYHSKNPNQRFVVTLEIAAVLPQPIPKQQIESHPLLKEMQLIVAPLATNFKLKEEEEEALVQVMDVAISGALPQDLSSLCSTSTTTGSTSSSSYSNSHSSSTELPASPVRVCRSPDSRVEVCASCQFGPGLGAANGLLFCIHCENHFHPTCIPPVPRTSLTRPSPAPLPPSCFALPYTEEARFWVCPSCHMLDNLRCVVCSAGEKDETMMLCDGCNDSYHPDCLGMLCIPEGDWFCPKCQLTDNERRACMLVMSWRELRGDLRYIMVSAASEVISNFHTRMHSSTAAGAQGDWVREAMGTAASQLRTLRQNIGQIATSTYNAWARPKIDIEG